MATLNLDYYRGPDDYSDGAAEADLLALFRAGRDAAGILEHDRRWPILYHLSPERRNLLEGLPFEPRGGVLEIGAGCGALTGLLCERAARVVAVESSRRRSEIIALRHARQPHLEVRAGNLMDMAWRETFGYVTLIGVLEYTRAFVATADPYGDFLRRAVSLLAPGGILVLALENKFGLKYFAGADEDHTGRRFDGIEGYPGRPGRETFSRPELSDLLRRAGCRRQEWFYPHPDYKFPLEIFSAAWPPPPNYPFHNAPNYDRPRFQLFSEKLALAGIARAGLFEVFANAFLVLAGREETP